MDEMEWGYEELQELMTTLTLIAATLNYHKIAIETALSCIEQLDARSQVTISAHQSLAARLEKLESVTYGDGK